MSGLPGQEDTVITGRSSRWVLPVGLKDALGTSTARALLLPVSGLASLAATYQVIGSLGLAGYGLFAIFVSLPSLIPISDFGIGVAVTDTASAAGVRSALFRSTWRRALLATSGIGLATLFLGATVALLGKWSVILGIPAGAESELTGLVVTACLSLGIPLALGQRLLLGAGRQTLSTVFSSCAPVISLLLIVVSISLGAANLLTLAAAYCVGPVLVQVGLFLLALRTLRTLRVEGVDHPESVASTASIGKAAWPMALMSITLPLTYQSDRVLLSHFGTLDEVAQYSVAASLYMPLLSVITVGSLALWPMYLRLKARGESTRAAYRNSTVMFSALAILLGLGMVTLGPLVAGILSRDRGVPHLFVFVAFAAMLLGFGVNAAAGMLLMDYRGRILQTGGSVLLLAAKIPLSLILFQYWGVAGVIMATFAPMVVFMVIPSRIVAARRMRLWETN